MTGRERQAAVDMTRGSPVKLILRFTLPLLIGQMMQQIYTLTDTMITGHFIGDAAIAAIGASTSLNDLMINFATECVTDAASSSVSFTVRRRWISCAGRRP